MLNYVIVSPVKDEERHVELTLRSVCAQTVVPTRWVIVNDGSTDGTAEIVATYARQYPFIKVVDHPKGGSRQPGGRVIKAFNYGRDAIDVPYDFIVKLDCDLSFEPDYFERLLANFRADDRLGIASGTYAELNAFGRWQPVRMPAYHAFGASKVLRRACFDEIDGFVEAKGWDTVDEIRAWSKGWRTGHFIDLPTRHHKPEGSDLLRDRRRSTLSVLQSHSSAGGQATSRRRARAVVGLLARLDPRRAPSRHRRGSALLPTAASGPPVEERFAGAHRR
jgi:poly-beta-1,6-N-acetyl-D-glucosamine synthase